MTIFSVSTQRDESQAIAAALLTSINDEVSRRVALHRDSFNQFWWSTTATPQEIADKMGPAATLFFQIANANVQHIAAVAAISGKQLGDFLQPHEYIPPRAITYNQDGTVTISEVSNGQ